MNVIFGSKDEQLYVSLNNMSPTVNYFISPVYVEFGECCKIKFFSKRSSRGNVFLKIHVLEILENICKGAHLGKIFKFKAKLLKNT